MIYWEMRKQKMKKENKYCLGCAVHHDKELNLELILGKCQCKCHKKSNTLRKQK